MDEHKQPTDIVIDLDAIKAQLSGLPWYHPQSDARLDDAILERNRRLRALAYETTGQAWLIVGAPTSSEREWWQRTLNGSIVLLNVPSEVCMNRIDRDTRRAGRAEEYRQAVRDWWARFDQGETELCVIA